MSHAKAIRFDREREAIRLCHAVESAGGDLVWVRGTELGGCASIAANISVRVLVESSNWDTVENAFLHTAKQDGLEAPSKAQDDTHGARLTEIALRWRNQREGVWRLQRVGEIRRAAIVIDDLGAQIQPVKDLVALPASLTFSVLPHLARSREAAAMAHRAGRAVILHMPMEPDDFRKFHAGPGGITVGMTQAEVAEVFAGDLGSVPYAGGVNNHEGSLATANSALMAELMPLIAQRNLYFIDSRTSGASVALQAARKSGVPAFYRSVFLDDRQSVAYTLAQLRLFRAVVEKQGIGLAIGHPHPTTIRALSEFLPEFTKDDIEIVPASRLVRLPQAESLVP